MNCHYANISIPWFPNLAYNYSLYSNPKFIHEMSLDALGPVQSSITENIYLQWISSIQWAYVNKFSQLCFKFMMVLR